MLGEAEQGPRRVFLSTEHQINARMHIPSTCERRPGQGLAHVVK